MATSLLYRLAILPRRRIGATSVFDALGNRLQQGHTITGSNGDTTTYSYTSATNRLIQTLKTSNGNTVGTNYSYDNAGSISEVEFGNTTVELDNNDDSRLAAGTVNQQATEQYIYDHLGQRMMKIGENPVYFGYDIFGNMFGELDMDGEPITTYIYLGNHRLAKIGGVASGGGGCSLSHNVLQGAKTNWVVILVVPVIILLGIKYRRNRYLVGLFVLIGASAIIITVMNEAKSTISYSEGIFYYHNDHLGTPQVMTDDGGDVVWDAAYQPFGKIQSYATQAITNRFRFPGQYEDDMTGMYYNHHRYYMPGLGRYNRVEAVSIKSECRLKNILRQQYIYVDNNPAILIDPKGLEPINCSNSINVRHAIENVLTKLRTSKCCEVKNLSINMEILKQKIGNGEYSCSNTNFVLDDSGNESCATGEVGGTKVVLGKCVLLGRDADCKDNDGHTQNCGCLEAAILHEGLHLIGFTKEAHPKMHPAIRNCFPCYNW